MWRFAIIQFFATIGLRLWPFVETFFRACKWCAIVFFFLCVGLITVALFTGCSLLNYRQLPTLSEKDVYRHELYLKVNDKDMWGTGVATLADKYNIKVFPPGKVDRIVWRTCNRENVIDKPDVKKTSWFGGLEYVEFEITPVIGLEDVNACALKIEVFEEKKRRNGLALIEFQDKREEVSLYSDLVCNGGFSQNRGVGICQSAAGLYQQISFSTPVVNEKVRPECDVMKKSADEMTYQFALAPGECTYVFVSNWRSQNGKRVEFRLNTIGYTDVPPMKE